jgi:hypothetical protein
MDMFAGEMEELYSQGCSINISQSTNCRSIETYAIEHEDMIVHMQRINFRDYPLSLARLLYGGKGIGGFVFIHIPVIFLEERETESIFIPLSMIGRKETRNIISPTL